MSHIDEGRVAAYLDGQLPAGSGETVEIELHVAACAECRTLLEEALRHRDRARAILRTGAPASSDAPPFEQVLRRAGAGTGGRRHSGQRPRLATLAWAATIVLAVGSGWYLVRNPSRGPVARSESDTVTPATSTRALARGRDSTAPRSQLPPAEVASGGPGRVAAEAADADSSPRVNAALAVAEPSAVPAAPAVSPAGQALAAAEARDRQDSARDRLERAGSLQPDAIVVTGQAAGAERRLADTPAAALALRALTADPDTWREASQGGAMRALGRLPLQIPDLPVVAYYVRSSGRPLMRVVQDLGQGQTVEIVQERSAQDSVAKAASDEAARNEAAAGNQVTDETDGYRTTIRGPVSLDSLSALLRKLR